MGGVPVLLMIAAMGITYGWQPDNSGGVEYVIQIPPDQLHEIERIGEISNAIDPALQGHVSRVIIKVGNAPLPRITPPSLARRSERLKRESDVIVVSDHSPIPIPEMDPQSPAIPISRLDSTTLDLANGVAQSDQAAVMKPDTNDPRNGPGFSFPSTPSSLRDTAAAAAEGIRSGFDRAGRELGPQASRNPAAEALSGGRVPPPATRSPSLNTQSQAPQFTGSDPTGELARTRASGPSTEPTNTRDNSWRDFSGARAGLPSTTPVSPSGLNSTNQFDGRTANANGLSPSDTFGKTPGGFSFPGATDNRATDRNAYTNRNVRTSPGGSSPEVYSQAEQTRLDRQAQIAASERSGRLQFDATSNGQRPSSSAYDQGGVSGYNSLTNATNNRDQQFPTTQSPDSRLTAAQIAAGAWSVDVYGRFLDRDGRLLETTTNPNASVAAYDQTGRQNERYSQPNYGSPNYAAQDYRSPNYNTSLGQPSVSPPRVANTSTTNLQNQPLQRQTGLRQTLPASTDFARESNRNQPLPRAELARRDVAATQTQFDPGPLTDRRTASVVGGGVQPRQKVAAQPLFNGLLLISFVANVYLIFWLKNLRLQFHDLVAAKRIANSNSVAT